MKNHFKRSKVFYNSLVCIPLGWLFMIFMAFVADPHLIISWIVVGFICVIWMVYIIIILLFWEDFDYYIEVLNDSFIIEIPKKENYTTEEGNYTISKTFTIEKTTYYLWRRIIIKDENSSVSIPYNKKVLQFLNQIKQ